MQTATVADVLRIPATYQEMSVTEAADALTRLGHLPALLVPSVLEVLGPDAAVLPVSTAVEDLTGHPALTFRQWVQENTHRF
jgi:hypothetical protein